MKYVIRLLKYPQPSLKLPDARITVYQNQDTIVDYLHPEIIRLQKTGFLSVKMVETPVIEKPVEKLVEKIEVNPNYGAERFLEPEPEHKHRGRHRR